MATNFESMMTMERHIKQLQVSAGLRDDYSIIGQSRDFQREMEYRKIDQLTAQLEKELAEVRRVRAELEAYKGQFAIEVKNTAQKEIDGLIAQLNKLGS